MSIILCVVRNIRIFRLVKNVDENIKFYVKLKKSYIRTLRYLNKYMRIIANHIHELYQVYDCFSRLKNDMQSIGNDLSITKNNIKVVDQIFGNIEI